ncbi:DUF4097 family beta strand repeat-containing protein [Streptomyces sp. G-G2]|uniref:DUF4097 family beta strand repeat-containing protein n=1 Tax=Streptomyces sp. G-G2 TaxID=3046201 RepID=UPI0024B93AD9|nr:DUF4097 family beta strand repeat-containing protein [Streptomyces sp. G-G2]MDJ0379305.1 DUF4097 family beta strand repeat-containing protein [Streptomyces sp. G-G2]
MTPRRPLALPVTVLAVLTAGLLVSGCSPDLLAGGDLAATKTATADATVTEAVTSVEVLGSRRGSIEVVAGAGPGVTIHRTVHYAGDTEPKPGQRLSGGALTFSDGCGNGRACYVDYRLEVPATAKVHLGSSSGAITVTGVAEADLSASSGSVRAERISGPLRVTTSSGEIAGSALGGSSAAVTSSSGDVRLDFTAPPSSVTADASSGAVTLRVPGGPYRVGGTTSSGVREVTVPTSPDATPRLTVHTSSGDVRITAS